MAESLKDLAAVMPTGIPWRVKSSELMDPQYMDMLYAILTAVVPPMVRESKIRGKKKLHTVYISDEEFHRLVAELKKNTVIFDSATEEEFEAYLAESPSDSVQFRQLLQGMLLDTPPAVKAELVRVLWALE